MLRRVKKGTNYFLPCLMQEGLKYTDVAGCKSTGLQEEVANKSRHLGCQPSPSVDELPSHSTGAHSVRSAEAAANLVSCVKDNFVRLRQLYGID